MAEANLQQAASHHRRVQDLQGRGSATAKNLEDATAAFQVARAAVDQAAAQLAAAEVTLGQAEIRAPFAGSVTARHVEPGDMATPGTPLFQIEDLSRVKVAVAVRESEVTGLAPGGAADVRVEALGESRQARIERVDPSGDPASRTYTVELVLDNPGERLKPAMFARATFERGRREVLAVPVSALVERGQLRGLFVVGDDSRARLRWIRPGRTADGGMEILAGLSAGERFLLAPPPELTDGARVEAR
jgi:RND family efflux transporter MFP subunit